MRASRAQCRGTLGDRRDIGKIKGTDKAGDIDGVVVFHAGTAKENGKLIANGGRVLGITASAKNVTEAQKLAYQAVDMIDWPDGFFRSDIGWRVAKKYLPR